MFGWRRVITTEHSKLIKIAAEIVTARHFISPCAEDHSGRTPKAIIAAAQKQQEILKEWSYRIRQIADELNKPEARDREVVERSASLAFNAVMALERSSHSYSTLQKACCVAASVRANVPWHAASPTSTDTERTDKK